MFLIIMLPLCAIHIILHILLLWGKSCKDCLCIVEDHLRQFGELVFIQQGNRKPGNFSARGKYVQNWKIETLTWSEG